MPQRRFNHYNRRRMQCSRGDNASVARRCAVDRKDGGPTQQKGETHQRRAVLERSYEGSSFSGALDALRSPGITRRNQNCELVSTLSLPSRDRRRHEG